MKTPFAGSIKMIDFVVTRHSQVRKTLLICGILSALIWMGTDILAAVCYKGYNYPFEPISGLSALDSPMRSFVSSLVNLYVLLKIAFAVGVWMTAVGKRPLRIMAIMLFTSGFIDLAAFFFPWNPSENLGTLNNIMHGLLAGGLTGLLFLLTIGFGAKADGSWFRFYSYGTLLVIIVSGGIMAFLNTPGIEGSQPPPWFGLTERINAYGFMVWMLMLAVILLCVASSSQADREIIINPNTPVSRV